MLTGSTSGIGLQTAIQLASSHARLVLIGRDRARGEAALVALRRTSPKCDISIHYADLARLDEVRGLASALLSALPHIDVLINNAGAIFARREVTADGLERTFALNHMAYFTLTELLRERLIRSAPARVVNVASEAHRSVTLDFNDLQNERSYNAWTAYRRSKLCNILFTRHLARRLQGTGVTANCLHPGFVASRFGDNTTGIFRMGVGIAKRLFAISPERGAATSVYLAASPDVSAITGAYFDKRASAIPSDAAQDDAAAVRLSKDSAVIAGL